MRLTPVVHVNDAPAHPSTGILLGVKTVTIRTGLCVLLLASPTAPLCAQDTLFDFDGAAVGSSLPLDMSVGGITAHFAATSLGYSIQEANVLGFTPQGFGGRCISPNSINLSDLLIRFDQALTHFSILYACQELGCDDAATMRVTAYMSGTLAGTATKTASVPGTWPTDTLGFTLPQGFDSVVVHYDSRPPTCQDYGVIFMADNMRVTPKVGTGVSPQNDDLPSMFALLQNYPNPFNPGTRIEYTLRTPGMVSLQIFNLLGERVATLRNAAQSAGRHSVQFDATTLPDGVYFYRLGFGNYTLTRKMLHLR